ncbi:MULTISPECIES: nucleoside deaminase [Bacillaceae]|uniref:tRNA-specific adenosine deaminase n=1 Tax=Gottfriedia luciferensis TaxID=178774 RepID=A0ABX2ZUN5_9BACI|nr:MULTISPECIES: nucleoside deaminase [Bacillaceae]ODG93407.1 tRNA-specific adenosine deaminase [Gottfriedia luciferensis]PGZ88790.1 nucleoside deaminase [Bacillus sp. AFS029533]SFC47819.1 guanine deaminase [Bacillus sp. UNCCL81]
MNHSDWIKLSVRLAYENLLNKNGGPFGAVIVQDGKVIGAGVNGVTTLNDPTAHAEVQAIRNACQNLGTYLLKDAVLYTSCEPCPMCLSAVYWSRISKIYYFFTKDDAAKIGFDDAHIYNELSLPYEDRTIPSEQIMIKVKDIENPFIVWSKDESHVHY